MKVDAHLQFQPSKEAVQAILDNYGLKLAGYETAKNGVENCTLVITDNSSTRYVLRVYRRHKKSDDAIITELSFVNFLAEHAVPVVTPVAAHDGNTLVSYEGWQAIVMPFIAGRHPATYTPVLCREMAASQARIHTAAVDFPPPASLPPIRELRDKEFITHVNDAGQLPTIAPFLQRARTYSVALSPELPHGLCHLDLNANNTLVDTHGRIAAILDFDDLKHAPYAVCLGNTLWDIWRQGDQRLVREHLEAYRTVRPLSDAEQQFLPHALLFRTYFIGALLARYGAMDQAHAELYLRLETQLRDICSQQALLY